MYNLRSSLSTLSWSSLQALRLAAARAARNNSSGCSEIRVLLKGMYSIAEPIRLTAADSGTEATPVVWTSAAGGRATVSGGAVVRGWQKLAGKAGVWSAPLPAGVAQPHQLFVGGSRRIRARAPNNGLFFAIEKVMGNANESDGIVLANGTTPPVADPAGVETVVYSTYFAQRYPVASVGTDRTVRFPSPVSPPRYAIYSGKHGKLSRAYLENAFEFLDAPGEWYANASHIFYFAQPGEGARACGTDRSAAGALQSGQIVQ